MPAKDTTCISLSPEAREHLEALRAYGESKGIRFSSASSLHRFALRIAAESIQPKAPKPGQRLKKKRTEAGLTQGALAALLGLSRAHLANMENGVSMVYGKARDWLDGEAAQ